MQGTICLFDNEYQQDFFVLCQGFLLIWHPQYTTSSISHFTSLVWGSYVDVNVKRHFCSMQDVRVNIFWNIRINKNASITVFTVFHTCSHDADIQEQHVSCYSAKATCECLCPVVYQLLNKYLVSVQNAEEKVKTEWGIWVLAAEKWNNILH